MESKMFILAVVALVISLAVGTCVTSINEQVTIEVTSKDRSTSVGRSIYQVYTKGETFRIGDSVYYMVWNSADRYSKLKVGKKYRCKASGIRVPMMSMFRNLIHCQKLN